MVVYNFTYTNSIFQSEDSRVHGEFHAFGMFPGIIHRQIIEGFSPVSLISLVKADPKLTDLVRSVMERKQLRFLFLDNLPAEHAVQVVLNWKDDMDCIKFKNETRDRAGELEMYRRAYTFILQMCHRTNTSKTQMCIDAETESLPSDLHLLRLPQINRTLSVVDLLIPVGAPFDFVTQFEAQKVSYIVPFRPDIDVKIELDRLENLYKSSPRV